MPIRYPTRTPFNQLPRRSQKQAFSWVKNGIKRASPILGGKFTTHDYMHGNNYWLDAHFIGTKPPVFYSLALQTTIFEYKELVGNRAWELSYELAPERELLLFDSSMKDPKTGNVVNSFREPYRYPELENMTRLQWAQAQHQKIADSGDIHVFENWTLQHDYRDGIGLHATIDAPVLTIEAVNAFVDRFLIAEENFLDPTPLTYRYEQVSYWGLDSNTLIESWQWDAAIKR